MINHKNQWLVLVNCHQLIILILLPQMMANQNQILLEKHQDFSVKRQILNSILAFNHRLKAKIELKVKNTIIQTRLVTLINLNCYIFNSIS